MWVVLAWNGDHFALIVLSVTAAFLAGLSGFSLYHWREALDGWRSTLDGWNAEANQHFERGNENALEATQEHGTSR